MVYMTPLGGGVKPTCSASQVMQTHPCGIRMKLKYIRPLWEIWLQFLRVLSSSGIRPVGAIARVLQRHRLRAAILKWRRRLQQKARVREAMPRLPFGQLLRAALGFWSKGATPPSPSLDAPHPVPTIASALP